ncbi:MAG: hypothetical protein ACXVCP_07185 [Bdellovibrio sp.]
MLENELLYEDLNFKRLLDLLLRNKTILLCFPITMVVFSFIIMSFMKPVWECALVVELGQFGQMGQDSLFIESPSQVISRLMKSTFVDEMLRGEKSQRDTSEVELFRKSIRASQIKKTDLIQIEFRAYSKREAAEFADLTVKQLIKAHRLLSGPRIKSLEDKLSKVTEGLQKNEKKIKMVQEWRQSFPRTGENLKDLVIVELLLERLIDDRQGLAHQKIDLEEQVDSEKSFMTRLVNEAVISDSPVSPNKLRISILVFVFGLFVTILAVFIRESGKQ